MMPARLEVELFTALTIADDPTATPAERAEMLMEIAVGLQQRPKTPEHLIGAVALYDRALEPVP